MISIDAPAKSSLGEMVSMRTTKPCRYAGCSLPVVVTFCQEALCLSHFCSSCYELLDRFECRNQVSGSAHSNLQMDLLVPNECARGALEISLSAKSLGNLERARLLDILLWSGDIANSFKCSGFRRPDPGNSNCFKSPENLRQKSFGSVES
jgi:hypothetical protein